LETPALDASVPVRRPADLVRAETERRCRTLAIRGAGTFSVRRPGRR